MISPMNIGTKAVEAARALQHNAEWAEIRAAVLEQSRSRMNTALESDPGHHRDDAVGYARALRDLWVSFESATTGIAIQRVVKPGSEGKSRAA